MKKVIHIYGASGSGTTSLGAKISKELGFSHLDSDDYYWYPTDPPFTSKRNREDRLSLLLKDIENTDDVVISGSLVGWASKSLTSQFTLAIRIVVHTSIRIERIRKREQRAFGSRIEDGGDMHKNHLEFLEWASMYDTASIEMRSKALHDEWEKTLNCPIIVVQGNNSLDAIFSEIESSISK